MDVRAAEALALRVLEQWMLIGTEPMNGEQWNIMCDAAGVDPETTAIGATYLRSVTTPEERVLRLKALATARSQDRPMKAMAQNRWHADAA